MSWVDDMIEKYGGAAAGIIGAVDAYNGTDEQTTKPYYLPGQEEALANTNKSAQDLYNQGPKQYYGGNTVADRDPLQTSGEDRILGNTGRMDQLATGSGQAATTLQGGGADRIGGFQLEDQIGFGIPKEYQDAIMNPFMRNLNEKVIPGLHTQATQQGAFGGSRMQQQKADAATQATTSATDAMIRGNLDARGQSIEQRQGDHNSQLKGIDQDIRQNEIENNAMAAGISGAGRAQDQLATGGQYESAIGTDRHNYDQRLINADKDRWDFNQQAPGTALDDLTARLTLTQPQSGSVTPSTGGGFADAIVGGLSGMNTYNQAMGK